MRYKQNLKVIGNKVYSYDTHVATIKGRQLLRLGWWSVTTSKHINHVANEFGLQVVDATDQDKEESKSEQGSGMLKTASMVASFMGILASNPKEAAQGKARMLKTVPGIQMPEDFESLPVEEQNKRLDQAIAVGLES